MAKRVRRPTNPFRFGGLALDDAFANREAEVQELKFDVLNGQDVVIFAPRRYGKSSLVWKTMQELIADGVLVAYVNLMTTPTSEKFAEKLAATIYENVASPAERAKEMALPRPADQPERDRQSRGWHLQLLLRRRALPSRHRRHA
jgi:hypothetical protein